MSDFRDLLSELTEHGVRFMVVGAHAVGVHGHQRGTADLDVWVERSPENAQLVWDALVSFGAPVDALGVVRKDFEAPGRVVQFGVPPNRIDLLTDVSGLEFTEAWPSRVVRDFEDLPVSFLSREDLIRNKRSSGRYKDLADIEALGEDPQG